GAANPERVVERPGDIDVVRRIQRHAFDGIDRLTTSAAGPQHSPGRIQSRNENILEADRVEGEVAEPCFAAEMPGDEQVAIGCRQSPRDVAVRHALWPGCTSLLKRREQAGQQQTSRQRQRGEMDWSRESHDLSLAHWFNTVTV